MGTFGHFSGVGGRDYSGRGGGFGGYNSDQSGGSGGNGAVKIIVTYDEVL